LRNGVPTLSIFALILCSMGERMVQLSEEINGIATLFCLM